MNLHEYQSKALFRDAGIPVPQGEVIASAGEAREKAEALGGERWVVKAQAHTGGRGKAGGVAIVDSLEQVESEAQRMLGMTLVTHQTGADGLPVNELLIEEPTAIARELYLSVLIDRGSRRVAFMASSAGGMNIEEVAAETPEKIITIQVGPVAGLQPYQCRRVAFALELEGTQIRELQAIMVNLYNLVLNNDASLVEINPLVTTGEGNLVALDAKINLDSNALYRHPNLVAMRDMSQEDEREAAAAEHELNYISLDGSIGCMVNGAGLAMATMDLVKLHGGEPANFLDVGGGATAERVAEAFKLILSDDQVKAVLVNIFGGIVRCDLIAEGIIKAVNEVGVEVPVVVRLEGTNAPQGLEMLDKSGLNLATAGGLTEAAKKVIELASA
ncbi:ADP-forming succinate--CoA ligase subunit beta [Solemya velum gill symbiont]|uniref:ADP-forming succinate--CoA ligase subunit beta n=1 Tax=Solemya velum gill symbiont TaxID=2340 RepID=UPI0009964518|nr:ADP-forming succinate--CoA ligase subunit beta [Solemya velum gill symbiont]OOZ47325.1 succinate--CoA ligase subunit beta [Solemya velum gill symbiont]OOZ49740.1 succinate--CoA ligase subunit beta [Solemya velum gill symbiont]OOZ52427.1 succinate--CoA ligase subunit beta [Solemya velum gill symbiont]OOZ55366.1 succinate--CoA ligase subunit beta [Solemya velum gill symbiont]OOZ60604.1 succinate--CoA ligase subunit beta [Solemya velum gill symbiont]